MEHVVLQVEVHLTLYLQITKDVVLEHLLHTSIMVVAGTGTVMEKMVEVGYNVALHSHHKLLHDHVVLPTVDLL